MQAFYELYHKALHVQNCQDFYSIVLDVCLALTTAQAKKTQKKQHKLCSGHNLGNDKLKS